MDYDFIREKLKGIGKDERLVITDKKSGKHIVSLYHNDDNEIMCYINAVSQKIVPDVEEILLLAHHEIDDIELDVMTHKIWFELMREKNASHFYRRCVLREHSSERHYLTSIKQDVGKYISIQGKTIGRLIGICTTDEDYYWMLLDNESNKINLSSCVGTYKVLDEQDKYRVHSVKLVKQRLEEFMSVKDIVDVVVYSELNNLKNNLIFKY